MDALVLHVKTVDFCLVGTKEDVVIVNARLGRRGDIGICAHVFCVAMGVPK